MIEFSATARRGLDPRLGRRLEGRTSGAALKSMILGALERAGGAAYLERQGRHDLAAAFRDRQTR